MISVNPTSKTDIRDRTQAVLKKWLSEATSGAHILDPSYQRLWETIGRQFTSGGKFLRPMLTVVCYEGYGGQNPAIYDLAAAQELLHVSLLIHDDIMDHDYTRRGQLNVAGEYLEYYRGQAGATHRALSAALLAGDLLQARGHQAIAASAFDADLRQAAAEVYSRQFFEVVAGQLLDIESEAHAQTPDHSLKVIKLKSASYSFTGPLLMGARAARAPQAAYSDLENLGNSTGIAFQLADDLLGVYGDEAKTGKPILSDMRQGKSTYTIRLTFQSASMKDKAWLAANWGRADVTMADLEQARQIIEAAGARRKTLELMKDHVAQAQAALARLNLPPASSDMVLSLIAQSVWREA